MRACQWGKGCMRACQRPARVHAQAGQAGRLHSRELPSVRPRGNLAQVGNTHQRHALRGGARQVEVSGATNALSPASHGCDIQERAGEVVGYTAMFPSSPPILAEVCQVFGAHFVVYL